MLLPQNIEGGFGEPSRPELYQFAKMDRTICNRGVCVSESFLYPKKIFKKEKFKFDRQRLTIKTDGITMKRCRAKGSHLKMLGWASGSSG